jgi:hypothetical protein
MPNPKTAWAVGSGVFLAMFAALSVTFDPSMAFALSLVATLAVKN